MLNSLTNPQQSKHGEYGYTSKDMVNQGGVPPRNEKVLDLDQFNPHYLLKPNINKNCASKINQLNFYINLGKAKIICNIFKIQIDQKKCIN